MRRRIGGLAALVGAASLASGAIVVPGTAGAATVRADVPPSPYLAGEFCAQSQSGQTVVAQDGKIITCENNNGLRWVATGAIDFSHAVYSGDASGTEVGLTTGLSGTPATAALGQGLSSAATNSAGLTKAQSSVPGFVINPAEAATVLDYASGEAVGIGTSPTSLTAIGGPSGGQAVSTAPPNQPTATANLINQAVPGLGSIGVLDGQASTLDNACPITQPVAYGEADAANVQLLNPSTLPSFPSSAGTGPILSLAGTGASGTGTASTVSQAAFTANGDGTYGMDTVAKETIAPVTVNLANQLELTLTVAGASPSDPVTLEAHAPAEAGHPATVTLTSNDVITLTLTAGTTSITLLQIPISQLGPNGYHEDLSTSSAVPAVASAVQAALNALASSTGQSALGSLGSALTPVVNLLGTVTAALPITGSLGHIDIDATPFAIGGSPGSAPTQAANGTAAAGQVDLIHLTLGLSASVGSTPLPSSPLSSIGTLDVGHLEAAANLNQAFACPAAVVIPPATGPASQAPAGGQSLPVTGGEGGLWQPGLGVGLLALGGGLLALVRRSRRRAG